MENNLENFLDKMYENSTIDSALCMNDTLVLLPKDVEKHIEENYKDLNEGHIFERALKIEDLKEAIKKLSPTAKQKLYETEYKDVGYDFTLSRTELVKYKKLVGYAENDVLKEENGKEFSIKKSIIPKKKEEFKTDILSLEIDRVNEEQAKNEYPDYIEEAKEGKLFVLKSAKPGRSFIEGKEIPPFNKWRNEYFIAIPEELK